MAGKTETAQQAGRGDRPAQRPWEDESRFCERCGISFVWTIEEQKQAARSESVAPSLCPGCRTLLPPPGRERGQVKWYNARKRFGFIVRHAQPDLFVAGTAIRGRRALRPGDLVEFSVGANAGGPAADAVTVLAHPDEETLTQAAPSARPANSSTKSS